MTGNGPATPELILIAQLRKSLGKMELALDAINESLVWTDNNGSIEWCNAAFQRLCGVPRVEVLGRCLGTELALRETGSRGAALENPIDSAAKAGRSLRGTYQRGEGAGARFLDVEGTCIDPASGEMAFVLRDVTERRRLDAELAEKTLQLERSNEAMQAFSYTAAHDLKAPLRAIDGWSHILDKEYGPALDDKARAYLVRLSDSARKMTQLIDGLIELARLARAETDWTAVDLSALALHSVARLRLAEPDRRIEVSIEPGLAARGDARLLQSVLDNLFDNAWKFTRRQPSPRIAFGAREGPEGRAFFVRDNGVGFDMAHTGKLFQTFQRLHLAREFPGTGIGLASVKRVIERHGGKVWAESALGEGATFFFTLGVL